MSNEWGHGPDDETMSAHEFRGEETMDLSQTRPPQDPAPPFPPGGSPASPPGPPPHGASVGPPQGTSPTWQGQGPGPSPWQVPPPAPPWAVPPGPSPHLYPAGAVGIPPGGYPPLPRRRRWPWWVAGAAAAVVTALVITLVALGSHDSKTASTSAAPSSTRVSASSRPAPTSSAAGTSPAAPALDAAVLSSLLASAEQVSDILHHVQMNPRDVLTSLSSDASIDPAKCASAVAPALESTYTGSGYTGVAVQGLMESSPGRHKVIQAVAAFPDEAAAQQFQAQQLSAWRGCRLTDVTVSFPGGQPADHATITIVSDSEGIASTVLLPAGASEHKDSECERAMASRRNVVVDVRACGQNTITAGVTLVRAINDNINLRP